VSGAARQRLVEWDDPAPLADAFAGGAGLAVLEAIEAGRLPRAPMASLLDIRLEHVASGRVALSVEPGEEHQNEVGLVHGGLASLLLDHAMGATVASTLAAGDRAAGIELNVRFIRPLRPGTGRVRAEGRIVHAGRRIIHAEAEIRDASDELLARAAGTFAVLRREGDTR
jgi:uncharacterized protein (TIGR00369 family)